MKRKLVTIVLVVIAMMGCTDKKVEIETQYLHHEILDIPDILIGSPVDIQKDGDDLVVLDYKQDSLFHRVDLKQNLYMGMFGAKGQGPNEFIYPASLNVLGNSCFSSYDISKKELSMIRLDTDENRVEISRLFKYNQMLTFDVAPVADSLFIVSGETDGAMFALMNKSGELLSVSDEYPYENGDEKKIPVKFRAMAYQGTLRVCSNGYFAYATTTAKQIHLYKVKDKMIKKVGEIVDGYGHYRPNTKREGAYGVAYLSNSSICYMDLAVTDKYVYALYSGRSFKKYKMAAYEGETIYVYDWTGKLVKTYQLDIAISQFCVDEDENRLFATANIPEPTIVRFDLD